VGKQIEGPAAEIFGAIRVIHGRFIIMENNPETIVLSHQEIYRGKIVNLHVDNIRLPSGKSGIREVVHHPGGVTAVPVLDDGQLLLIRQFRYPIQKYIFELPAGKLDSNQPPLQTMMRELEEETGYSAGRMDYQCAFYTSPGISDELIYLYLARNLTPVPQHLEEGEHLTVEACPLDLCLERIQTGEIADGKTILGILWYHHNLRDR
jgi:ADP-ribose pyrophosphatase